MTESMGTSNIGLARRSMSGLRWMIAGLAGTSVMQLASVAVTSRYLRPSDLGLLAVATLLMRLVTFFSGLGVANALVQFPTITRAQVRTALSCALLAGVAGAVLCSALAPLAALIAGSSSAAAVTLALAGSQLVQGPGQVGSGLLRRNLRFRALACTDLVSYAVGYLLVGVPLAVRGAGVWSLVAAILVQSTVSSVATLTAAQVWVVPRFDRREAAAITGFGGRAAGASFLEFWGLQLDSVGIGLTRGTTALGFYSRGATVVTLPLVQLSSMIVKVFGATFSRVHRNWFAPALRDVVSIIALIVFPAAAILAAMAPTVVNLLLGSQWLSAASFLPMSLLAAALQCLNETLASATEALGELNSKIKVQVLSLTVFAALVTSVSATSLGLWAFAAAWAATECVRLSAYLHCLSRKAGLDAAAIGRNLCCAAALALPAATVAYFASRANHHAAVGFVFGSTLAIGTYVLTWLLFAPRNLRNTVLTRATGAIARPLPRIATAAIGGRLRAQRTHPNVEELANV